MAWRIADGLHVAALAGVLRPVFEQTRRRLDELETESQRQLQQHTRPHSVTAALASNAPDELCPGQTLDALYRLTALAEKT